jgi:HEAT repeat protein
MPTRYSIEQIKRLMNGHDVQGLMAVVMEADNAAMRRAAVRRLSSVLVESDDNDLRMVTAKALGEIGDERAIAALKQALADEHLPTRGWAAVGLGSVGDYSSLLPLLDDREKRMRQAAFAGIRRARNPEAIAALRARASRAGPIDRMRLRRLIRSLER